VSPAKCLQLIVCFLSLLSWLLDTVAQATARPLEHLACSLGDMIRERETSRPSVRATNHQAGARDLPGNDEKELFFHVSFLLTDASGMDLCVEVCDQGEFFGITPREALNEDGQRERLQEMCTALLEPVAGRQPPLPKRRRDAPEAAAAAGTVPQSAPVPAEPGGHCFVIKKFSVVSSGNSQSQRTESLTQSARFSQSQGASAAAASQREPLPKTEVRYTVAPGSLLGLAVVLSLFLLSSFSPPLACLSDFRMSLLTLLPLALFLTYSSAEALHIL